MDNNDFKDLVAIVTGGSSGIGKATARLLQLRGAKVFVFDKNKPVNPINNVKYLVCDITNKEDVNKYVNEVSKDGLDILINNAGIGVTGNVTQASDAEWHKVLDVNVVGTARMSAAAIPFLRKSKSAAIVNVSSTVSLGGFSQIAVYSASKGAVNALTLAMAADHIREGIRINCVVPATADTPWVERFLQNSPDPQKQKQEIIAMQPMQRLVTPYEIAHAICYLASPVSISTTGTILNVDGGVSGLRF
ncbi:FabG Dehydrogenases with different specificities (related to short-chain alcohol dehydrogenases) [uncultured Caudovirales phage]|uniref:FabG Dehydrogenases with different specificities (Related to short-chain alcohol dehydrogenases) n=1 Tax=uncultured Caudovirales phage TaxID=2100421 RepID=A0A6J5P0Z6_9CAUD|nr:FabG Dehydrogenases with different specificities (related to short-chain alcohol dehydrogenases) [uncultured Caudovirales phage]